MDSKEVTSNGGAPDTGQNLAPKRRWKYRWQRPFLVALARTGTVTTAADAAKVERQFPYVVRQEDPDFRAAWQSALRESVDTAEAEAKRRAVEGVSKPVLHNGKPVFVWVNEAGEVVPGKAKGAKRVALMETRYSDDLLKFWLKGRRPSVFGDRMTHAGDAAQPVQVVNTGNVKHEHTLSPEALRQFAADVAAAGLGHVPDDGGGERVDSQGPDRPA